MAREEYLAMLRQGHEAWNQWRDQNPSLIPDLSNVVFEGSYNCYNFCGTNLTRANLMRAHFLWADFTEAYLVDVYAPGVCFLGAHFSSATMSGNFHDANFTDCTLCGADLRNAMLGQTSFVGANLSGAILRQANLTWSNLARTNLSDADLRQAILQNTVLIASNLTRANISGCRVYGMSAWDLILNETRQSDLIITKYNEPTITVDNVEISQFLYLLLNNNKLRNVIDTITSKVALILGRFTPQRKLILDELRKELRTHDYLPILFDFDVPTNRDVSETVSLLAGMARFIIADLTEPSSLPKELELIVPRLAVPVQPLIHGSNRPYSMFADHWKYDWVLPIVRYDALEPLLATLKANIIDPAEAKVSALEDRRRRIEADLIAASTQT